MITQLILSTLVACQNKAPSSGNTQVTKTDITTTSTTTQKPEPKKTADTSKATIKGLSIVDSVLPPEEKLPRGRFSLTVHASDLNFPDRKRFCLSACEYAFVGESWMELSAEGECTLELIKEWEAKVKSHEHFRRQRISTPKGSEANPPLGRVTCKGEVYEVVEGRRMVQTSFRSSNPQDLAGYFASVAQEEAVSVYAFQEMLFFLKERNAPDHLIQACHKAIHEEKEHTAMMTQLAHQHGCTQAAIKIKRGSFSSMFDFAMQNAIAGCIEETWASVLALYRAQHTPKYQERFTQIARDEIGHAQLSWHIHQWAMSQLSTPEQQHIIAQMKARLKQPVSNRQGLISLSEEQHHHGWSHFARQTNTLLDA